MGVLGETAGLGMDDGLVHGGGFWATGTGVGGNLWAGLAVESWDGLGATGQGSDLGGWYGSGARGDRGLLLSSAASGGLLTSGWITGGPITGHRQQTEQFRSETQNT